MWKHTGSNRGPSACKADALNQLSYASLLFLFFRRDCKDKGTRHFSKPFFKKKIFLCVRDVISLPSFSILAT